MTDTAEQTETQNAVVPLKPKPELVAGNKVAPIVPRTVDEVARVANAVIFAGLAPSSYEGKTPDETRSKIMIGIMKGAEVGLPPITALSGIAIINNRPCIWGDAAVALVQQSGKVASTEVRWEGAPGEDERACTVSIYRVGQESPYVGRFSMADAKRARLLGKGPWMSYPDRMLFNRARAYALRDGFADCLNGLAIAEEVQDLPAAPAPVNSSFLEDAPAQAQDKPHSSAPSYLDDEPADAALVEDISRPLRAG